MQDSLSSRSSKDRAATRSWTDDAAGLAPHEARALAQTSRRRVVESVAGATEGRTVAELADLVGLHPNALRKHLEVLSRAGVVVATPAPPTGRRGRPSMRYSLPSPHAVAGVGGRELIRLLLELVHRLGASSDTAEALGIEQGARLVPEGAGPEALVAAFAGLGFAPREVTSATGRVPRLATGT